MKLLTMQRQQVFKESLAAGLVLVVSPFITLHFTFMHLHASSRGMFHCSQRCNHIAVNLDTFLLRGTHFYCIVLLHAALHKAKQE